VGSCDPPVVAFLRNDGGQWRGFATIYVCSSADVARRAIVMAGYPGARIVRGNFVAVVNGDETLRRDVQRVLRTVVD